MAKEKNTEATPEVTDKPVAETTADTNAPAEETPVQEGPVALTLEMRVDAFTHEVKNRIGQIVGQMKNEDDKTFNNGVNIGVTVASNIEEAFDPKQAKPMNGEPVLFAIHLNGVEGLRVGIFHDEDNTLLSTESKDGVYKLEEIVYWRPVSSSMRAFHTVMAQQVQRELKEGAAKCKDCSDKQGNCQDCQPQTNGVPAAEEGKE